MVERVIGKHDESLFVRACRREAVERTPVWFMRQAGRYMAPYRALRARHSMLELCTNPELSAQVTLQPITALDVDAAIIFSDILVPLVPMGFELEYVEGTGPVIHNPIRARDDVTRLRPVNVGDALGYVSQSVRLAVSTLSVPLIGFAGAPFTLASYLIEGGSSRSHLLTKQFMYAEPEAWHTLLEEIADVVAELLAEQVRAGAAAVQLFDSWVGFLSPKDYDMYVLRHSRSVLQRVSELGVPVIHFGVGTGSMLELLRAAGGSVIGVDWRTPLGAAWDRLGADVAVQGNLDPAVLFAPRPVIREQVEDVVRQAGGRPGHIFNLGHGIHPGTPVGNVQYVVELVAELTENASIAAAADLGARVERG